LLSPLPRDLFYPHPFLYLICAFCTSVCTAQIFEARVQKLYQEAKAAEAQDNPNFMEI
jgi:hypothetical protein